MLPNDSSDLDYRSIPISAIAQYTYCPRRFALMFIERSYEDNQFTIQGKAGHEEADTISWEVRFDTRLERALPLRSEKYGLHGIADAVEFRSDDVIYPVEYKRSKRRQWLNDDLQLFAQAICLEEMFGKTVKAGAIYHIASRRRREVEFSEDHLHKLLEVIGQINLLMELNQTPPPLFDNHCPNCSLYDICSPEILLEARYDWHLRDLYRLGSNSAEDEG